MGEEHAKKHQSGLEGVHARLADTRQECIEESRQFASSMREECRQEFRQGLDNIARHIFGPTYLAPGTISGAEASTEPTLAGRLVNSERQIEDLRRNMDAKADTNHSHDRIVSADGSVTFAL